MTPQEQGRQFEREIAEELGAKTTVASGALWFDKLDGSGSGFKISAKYTGASSFSVSQGLVDESVKATQGMGGDGSTPIIAIRLQEPKYDLIVLRKNDFLALLEDPSFIAVNKTGRSEERRKRADVPILFREEE